MLITNIDGQTYDSRQFNTYKIVEYSGDFVVAAMIDANNPKTYKKIIRVDDKKEAEKILNELLRSLADNVGRWDVNDYIEDGKVLI